jgi:hypothetical protein
MAAEPAGGTPDEFGRLLVGEIVHWGKVIKDAKITMAQ